MISKLHHRLTVLFSVLTSLVLLGALCVTFDLSDRQYKAGMEDSFSSAFTGLVEKLISRDQLSDDWLSLQEASALRIIHIEDNGTPLHFSGAWLSKTERNSLVEKSREIVQNRLNLSSGVLKQTTRFTLVGEAADEYWGAAAYIRLPSVQPQNDGMLLLLLQDTSPILRNQKMMMLRYLLLWLSGSLILGVLNWFLTAMALRPTKQALSRQNEFVAAASHELRGPLAVITASIEAAQGAADPFALRKFLKTTENEANRMARLTDDLLLLAGSDAKAWRMKFAPMQLDTFCIELYEQFESIAKKNGHPLTLCLPQKTLPTVEMDAERFKQIFTILFNNALEYSASRAPIEIVAECDNTLASISFVDHGKGIPDEEKNRVFERFYRTDKSRNDKTHFGLGLSIAKEIATLHAAELKVFDTPGGGATFRVVFTKKTLDSHRSKI